MIYCLSCDKDISKNFIRRHNKSKTHLYFQNNYVIKKILYSLCIMERF